MLKNMENVMKVTRLKMGKKNGLSLRKDGREGFAGVQSEIWLANRRALHPKMVHEIVPLTGTGLLPSRADRDGQLIPFFRVENVSAT